MAADLPLRAAAFALALSGCAADDSAYYAQIEGDLRAIGYLRTETDPADAPYAAADLVRDFQRIAFFTEYGRQGDRFVLREESTLLSRWESPIRMRIVFGPAVEEAARRADIASVTAFATRLAALSGLDIRVLEPEEEEGANFVVLFAGREERRGFADDIAAVTLDADPALLDSLRNSPASEICYVNTFWEKDSPGRYAFAFAVIKDEARGLMRESCIHEELTQALGLGNDSPDARPSIFNDDEEFALLTRHDEDLLRMLYNPALRPGMSLAEARPLLAQIATGLRPPADAGDMVQDAPTVSPAAP